MTSDPVMLRYTDETPTSDTSNMEACSGVRADLRHCLLDTDCCRKEKKSPRQCLQEHHPSIPQECRALLNTFFECKRSLLDMRQRFRGRKGY